MLTQKRRKRHFGYKLLVNVDKKSKAIRQFKTETVRQPALRAGLRCQQTRRDVYADHGYPSDERKA